MTPTLIILFAAGYFGVLLIISWLTGQQSDNQTFFLANRNAPWFVVAFGMIGATLSGITFISVPGWVADSQFSYMQMVLGYMAGYVVIGTILLPLYYRMNLTSIYTYLMHRYGNHSYKTGAFYFMVSRLIGAAFRLYLIAMVLQSFVFQTWGVPFWVTVVITLALIWTYTFRSGIKTIVWTDTLQTLFMLLAVIFSILLIGQEMNWGIGEMAQQIKQSNLSRVFFFDSWKDNQFFFKEFVSGMFITIVMTGLDQDMMQKNLSCRNLKSAQKNMFWFSVILFFVKFIFLCLGALLYLYAQELGLEIPAKSDELFPHLALTQFPTFTGAVFILGLIAATYSSADSALTALTTSFCVDFLGWSKNEDAIRTRYLVHLGFSVVLLMVILLFRLIHNEAIISMLFKAAGFTYGPLLGLYSFGLFTRYPVYDKWVPVICIIAPLLSFFVYTYSQQLFYGYEFQFEHIILNGGLTFLGLWLLRAR